MGTDVVVRRTRWLVRVAVTLVILTLVATAALVYMAVGWQRMDAACSTDEAVPPGASGSSVAFGWSWSPLGLACTWPAEDGSADISITKLWW